jgi:hypothetical protein
MPRRREVESETVYSRPFRIVALVLVFAGVLLAPGGAVAKPPAPPQQLDTARATGANFVLDDFSVFDIRVDAFSGPSGEDPGGHVSFDSIFIEEPVSGPVTCLDVEGKTATMTVAGPFSSFPNFLAFTVTVVDNGGSGLDLFQYFPVVPEHPEYLDCRLDPIANFGGPLDGRAEVFDGPARPTSKADCVNGGFARFGFRNQGQCIAFVNHGS